MVKKRILAIALAVLSCMPSWAVLNEKNLSQTLSVLRIELETTYDELKQVSSNLEQRSAIQHRRMVAEMQKSNQVALMLYSQNQNFTFNLTYACHEASEQYNDFTREMMPYDLIMSRMNNEIDRYNRLIGTLQMMPPALRREVKAKNAQGQDSIVEYRQLPDSLLKHDAFTLDAKGQADRMACLKYCIAIRNVYSSLKDTFAEDAEHYQFLQEHLQQVNDYAQKKYKAIQQNIFVNGDYNYFELLANMRYTMRQFKQEVNDKYGEKPYKRHNVRSQWRGPIFFGLVLTLVFYLLIAFGISNLVVRLLLKHVKRFQTEDYKLKMGGIIMTASLVVFALVVMLARRLWTHNFFLMASSLMVGFAWLMIGIFVSLLIRMKGKQTSAALKLYAPIIILGLIVIVFRIIFVPNIVVSVVFPPLLLLFSLWQWWILKRVRRIVPASDVVYASISLGLMVVSCIVAWMGFMLLSVQIFIWWVIQLTAIATITCLYDIIKMYEGKVMAKKIKGYDALQKSGSWKRDGKNINVTWVFDFLLMVFIPVSSVLSVPLCIYYAADVFDLTDICKYIFLHPFVNIQGLCKLSIFKVAVSLEMFFIFNYICYLIKAFYRYYRIRGLKKKNKGVAVAVNQANFTLMNNVTSIIVWGAYALIVLYILQVPKSGLSIVTAGLATGVGFAMKDLLENFFYGISLMAGRLRVGDWIECDGVRGKVDRMSYQSTQIVTDDGCVIAFLNATLFTKNFKNLTRNHSYEMSKITIGVGYDTDIEQARKLIVDCVTGMIKKGKSGRDIVSRAKGVHVLVSNLGESSIDLLVVYWTLVEGKVVFDCLVKEAVFNVLKNNNIEIPFPQRDVHIRNIEGKIGPDALKGIVGA